MPKKIAEIICPHCRSTVVAYRDKKGRIYITTSLGVVLAVVGGIVGSAVGIASGGWAIPATIPVAALGLVVGSGAGYLLGDKALDKAKCPKCGKAIDIVP
jgi:predicted RNA-binding Zn-ribbon protein involved in translation (DUF1610 family)